jgi:hypothetical protein
MPQIMKPDVRQAGAPEHLLEGAVKIPRFEGGAEPRGEDEALIVPARPGGEPFSSCRMRPKRHYERYG